MKTFLCTYKTSQHQSRQRRKRPEKKERRATKRSVRETAANSIHCCPFLLHSSPARRTSPPRKCWRFSFHSVASARLFFFLLHLFVCTSSSLLPNSPLLSGSNLQVQHRGMEQRRRSRPSFKLSLGGNSEENVGHKEEARRG